MTLEVGPEIASKIQAQARERGVSVDTYLRELIEEKATKAEVGDALTPQEKVQALREWTRNHSVKNVVADDSRESIYTREDESL